MKIYTFILSITLFVSCNPGDEYEGYFYYGGENNKYRTDANIYVTCDQKTKIPVAREGEYLTLKKKFKETKSNGISLPYVRVKGQLKKIIPWEGGEEIDALLVTEILEFEKDKRCPSDWIQE